MKSGENKCPMFLAAQGTNPNVGVTCSDRNIGQRSIFYNSNEQQGSRVKESVVGLNY